MLHSFKVKVKGRGQGHAQGQGQISGADAVDIRGSALPSAAKSKEE